MAGITLTPGSRRKLLRHIDEGLYIGDLARKMDISLVAIRKIILADEELKEVCHQMEYFHRKVCSHSVSLSISKRQAE